MQAAVPSTILALPGRMPKCTLVALAGQLTHSALAFSVIGNAPGCGLSGSTQEAVVNNYQSSEPCELSAGDRGIWKAPLSRKEAPDMSGFHWLLRQAWTDIYTEPWSRFGISSGSCLTSHLPRHSLQRTTGGTGCLLPLSLTFLLFSNFKMDTLLLLEKEGTDETVGPKLWP